MDSEQLVKGDESPRKVLNPLLLEQDVNFDQGALTDDELSDLAFAFQACDVDSDGAIDVEELHAMVLALGNKQSVTLENVQVVVDQAKTTFREWRQSAADEYDVVRYPGQLLYHGKEPGATVKDTGWKRHHAPLAIQKTQAVGRVIRANQNDLVKDLVKAGDTEQEKLSKISQRLAHDEHDDLHDALETMMNDHSVLIYAEYVIMVTHGTLLEKYMPGDWHKSAWKMRLLKSCYDTADVDGNQVLEKEELEMVICALDPAHGLSHEDIDYLWSVLSPDGKTSLSFKEYLHGMNFVNHDKRCSGWIDVAKPNKWELLSLLIDTPHSEETEQRLLGKLSAIERGGIKLLTKMKVPMEREHMREVLTKAGAGKLRELNVEQIKRMREVHWACFLWCAAVGFVLNIPVAAIENILMWIYETDGMVDTYWNCHDYNETIDYDATQKLLCQFESRDESACRATFHRMIPWWILNMSSVGFWVVFEIGLLMYFAAKYSVKVSWALDFRLVPLNADRAFVADSLVRAAFELGNPDSPVLGVDPHAEGESTKGKCRTAFLMLLYKGKIVVHGAINKFIIGKTTPPWFFMWAKPWFGTVFASTLWDGLVGHCIINQAEVRGFGIYTSVECFNEILELHFKSEKELSGIGRLELVRAVGVAIVKQGSMYCTMELLLRHTIQYLGLRGRTTLSKPGTLDNQADFVQSMEDPHLTRDEKIVVISVHILAHLLDGWVNRTEMACIKAVVDATGDDIAGFYPERINLLAWRFRNYEFISAQDLHDCFRPDAVVEIPSGHRAGELWYRLTAFLTC